MSFKDIKNADFINIAFQVPTWSPLQQENFFAKSLAKIPIFNCLHSSTLAKFQKYIFYRGIPQF